MATTPRLPSPSLVYDRRWADQFARVLEKQNQDIWVAIQNILLNVAPNYTTAEKLTLSNIKGQVIFDTTLGKLCVNTGAGWETITSTP